MTNGICPLTPIEVVGFYRAQDKDILQKASVGICYSSLAMPIYAYAQSKARNM